MRLNRHVTQYTPKDGDGREEIILLVLDDIAGSRSGILDVLWRPSQNGEIINVGVMSLHVCGGVMAVVPARVRERFRFTKL